MTFSITGKTILAANLSGNYISVNEVVEANELIGHATVSFTITGAKTLTVDEKNSGHFWLLTGSPGAGFTLTIPDGDRKFWVINTTGQTATLDTVGVSTVKPTVDVGETKQFRLDGDELTELSSGGGGGSSIFTGLTDTPANYSGAGSKFLAVNSGATAVEFVTTGVGGGAPGGPWEALEIQSPSGATEVDFVLPSGYYNYWIEAVGVVGTDGADINLRVSTDGGSSFVSGAASYQWAELRISASAEGHGGSTSADHIQLLADVGSTGNEYFDFRLEIKHPSDTSVQTAARLSGALYRSNGDFIGNWTTGEYLSTAAVDAIRIYPAAGAVTGTFILYGLKSELTDASAKTITEIDVSAGGTITLTDTMIRGADFFKLTGAPAGAFTLEVPDGDRRYRIWNASGQSATIDTVTGSATTITVANGERWEIQQDGNEMVAKIQLTAV